MFVVRRSKPMFPMTYTARATLEIGSGSVGSGRAVTTTTASNQVRTERSAPRHRPPEPHTPTNPQISTNSMRADGSSPQTADVVANQSRPLDDIGIKGGGDVSVPCGPKFSGAYTKNIKSCELAGDGCHRNDVDQGYVVKDLGNAISLDRDIVEKVFDNIDALSKANVSNVNKCENITIRNQTFNKVEIEMIREYRRRIGDNLVAPNLTSLNPKNFRSCGYNSHDREAYRKIRKESGDCNNKDKYKKQNDTDKTDLDKKMDKSGVAELNQCNVKSKKSEKYIFNNFKYDVSDKKREREIPMPNMNVKKFKNMYKKTDNIEISEELKMVTEMVKQQNHTSAHSNEERPGDIINTDGPVSQTADENVDVVKDDSDTELIEVSSADRESPITFSDFVLSQQNLLKRIGGFTDKENYNFPVASTSGALELDCVSRELNEMTSVSKLSENPLLTKIPNNAFVFLTLPKNFNNTRTNQQEIDYKGKNKKKSKVKIPKTESLHKRAVKLLLYSDADSTNKVGIREVNRYDDYHRLFTGDTSMMCA